MSTMGDRGIAIQWGGGAGNCSPVVFILTEYSYEVDEFSFFYIYVKIIILLMKKKRVGRVIGVTFSHKFLRIISPSPPTPECWSCCLRKGLKGRGSNISLGTKWHTFT